MWGCPLSEYGPLNWIATVILVDNMIFHEVRQGVKRVGSYLESHVNKVLGKKVTYLPGCHMCMGVWIGFVVACIFEGPVQSDYIIVQIVANGLVFKAIGHLYLRVSAWLHQLIETRKALTSTFAPEVASRTNHEGTRSSVRFAEPVHS